VTRVLLCDDSSQIRDLVRIVLELEGVEVVGEAGNGREAVERAAREQPDVVLLDLSMPVMDGLEALPEILRVAPGSKVVVLSGLDNRFLVERALEQGAVRYVLKGGDPGEIAGAVAEAGAA
jgi:DNA-binding NarL/FixJ family response regulator